MIRIASSLIKKRALFVPSVSNSMRFKADLPHFISKDYEFDFENYPKLKPENYQLRDPYKKYDDQQLRRNFNEPLHPNQDLLDMWAPDFFNVVDDKVALRWFITFFVVLGSGVTLIYLSDLYPDRPNYPRTYPHDGLAKDLGAKDESDAHLYRARIDKTA